MAGESGPQADSLSRRLEQKPYSFDFFQALRRIDCAHPELPPLGHSMHAAEDPVRFGQNASLAFPASTIAAFEPGEPGRPPRMALNCIGLLGPNGPMPLHITDYVQRRAQTGDRTVGAFLDMFHHRMASLFYRAWACAQMPVQYEQGAGDRFALYVGSLFGLGMASLRDADEVPDEAKFHYAGRLACQTRNAEGLRALLADYFGIPTDLIQFVGQWLPLPPECYCRLGESPQSGSLGRTTIVGEQVWECQQKFRIVFGPMLLADYERMLPGTESVRQLVAWVHNYAGQELCYEVQLILKAQEVPQIQLGQQGRLGLSTWLAARPLPRDADDLVFTASAA